MNSSIQRIAELEAEVASLKGERDVLKRKSGQSGQEVDIEAIADLIETRLNRVERNLREDFVGKFAGNFLLATETITNRVVALEERELRLEKQYKELEIGTEKLLNLLLIQLINNQQNRKKLDRLFVKRRMFCWMPTGSILL